jgi:hypothetical protein
VPIWLLNLIEAMFLASVVAGVALIYIPAGLISAGLIGLVACEWTDIQRKLREARTAKR